MTTETMTAFHRTLLRSISHVLADEERAGMVLDSILDRHPQLAQLWDEGVCRGCHAVLREVERVEGHHLCEFCCWQVDHDKYVENLRMYGSE